MENKFTPYDTVTHVKTGGEYFIRKEPVENHLLEYCNEPHYVYWGVNNNKRWVRCKSEMEDGRFELTEGT